MVACITGGRPAQGAQQSMEQATPESFSHLSMTGMGQAADPLTVSLRPAAALLQVQQGSTVAAAGGLKTCHGTNSFALQSWAAGKARLLQHV